jgi:hypothetical protein
LKVPVASRRGFSSIVRDVARSATFGSVAAFAGGLCVAYGIGMQIERNSIKLETVQVRAIQPDTKVDPFPVSFTYQNTDYDVLGVGVRSVSFLSFHVYALAIYIARDDILRASKILSSAGPDSETIRMALLDPVRGGELISKLLNSGVRLSLRIVPVRNTDFGHLRDGFVRAVVGHPRFKEEGNSDEVGEGIAQLKKAFGRKMTVKKGRILYLHREASGQLAVEFFNSDDESSIQPEQMGTIELPLISELLFLQYLSGPKPSSESARQTCVEALASLQH